MPVLRKNFPASSPTSSSTAPGHAVTSSAPSAGATPRPPAPRRNGDQLWPDDRESPGDGGDGGAVAGEQRADRALGDVEDAGHRERPETGDAVERGARHGAAAELPEVDAAHETGGDVGERHGAADEREQ